MSVLVVSALVFLAVALTAIGLFGFGRQTVRARLDTYTAANNLHGFAGPLEGQSFEERFLPSLRHMADALGRLAPGSLVSGDVENRLERAGYPLGLDASTFFVVKAALLFGLPVIYGGYLLLNAAEVNILQIVTLIGAFYLGFRAPDWWLDNRIGARQTAINLALPDALDFLVICVEAGLAFEGALARVASRIRGPLAEEIRRTLGEISLGKRRRDALKDLATRTGAHDLMSFIAAVVQADQTGISISNVLRVQAEDLRRRRRQRAEKEGREAPLKMLIPLIFFMFPATFIVVIGPAVLSVIDNMFTGQ